MAKMSCFSFLFVGKKKRSKVIRSKVAYAKKATGNDCPKVKPVEFMDMADTVEVSEGGVNAPACDTNVFVRTDAEPARQVRDANEDKASSNREPSAAGEDDSGYRSGDNSKNAVSVRRMSPPASPELKRSCSNIETARSVPVKDEFDLPPKSRSYGDLKALPSGRLLTTPSGGAPDASTAACSVLKKPSSRQVLPSQSRKRWWRLFLCCHRNLHRRPSSTMPALPSADIHIAPHQNDGYTSDTLDAVTSREPKNKRVIVEEEPIPNQWVAFPSPDRVSAWVNSLGSGSFHVVDEDEDVTAHDDDDSGAVGAWCSEIVECSTAAEKQHARAKRRTADEAVRASSIVQTLNAVSSVAHMSGMGLQAVPMIAAFSSLRAVNLSGNFIAHVYPGSLPKGLHSLDLSRNKIGSIEGLRELMRLRVLNLSYNRISRIGHGKPSMFWQQCSAY